MSTPHFPATDAVIRKAVIPAAGMGTRLRPLTNAFPKELLPIGRKPVLAHIAAELRGAGITDALFIVSERKPQIRSYFGDMYRGETTDAPGQAELPPLRCSYVVQTHQRGLGDALLYAEEWTADSPFVVAFGDCMMDAPDPSAPLRRMLAAHDEHRAAATVLTETVPRERVFQYGVLAPANPSAIDPGNAFAVSDIVEKPSPGEAPSNLVVAARWALGSTIFRFLRQVEPDSRGELNLTDAVRALLKAGGGFWASPLIPGERRQDIGNFETFFASFVRAALRDPEFGESARLAASEELATLTRVQLL
jgi:UTP--glucose-1-phosphate uridylyltransferase